MAAEVLKFFHLLFAFVLVGGIAITTHAVEKARRTSDPDAFAGYLKAAALDGDAIATPGALLAGIFGWLTARQQGRELETSGWLVASYVVLFLAIMLGLLVDKRKGNLARALQPQARANAGG